MKVKILRSISGASFSFMGGEIAEMSEECGQELIRAGHAEEEESVAADASDADERAGYAAELAQLGVVVRPNCKTETVKLKLQETKAKIATNDAKPVTPWAKAK